MDQDWPAEHWLRQPVAPEPGLAAIPVLVSVGRPLLERAEHAARRAGDLIVDWFWLRQTLWSEQAERLSRAAERGALASHRAGHLVPPPRRVV